MLQNRSVCHCRNTLISFPVNELGGIFIFLHRKCDILPPQAGQVTWHSTRARKQVPLPVVQPQTKQNQISITMKKTFITLLALAGIACGETTVLTFDGVVDPNNQDASVKVEHDFDTDEWNIRGLGNGAGSVWSGTQTLTDGTVAGLNINSGKFWDTTPASNATWGNTDALTAMNDELGTNISADDLTSVKIMASAGGGSHAKLTLNFTNNTSYGEGDQVVFYLLGGSYDNGDAYNGNITVTGLTGVTMQWAASGGKGFTDCSTTAISADKQTQVLIRVQGALTSDQSVAFVHETAAKSGWGMAAYAPAVPEPATATLSLLALAGLAARRRRK